jgi:FtsH-binding integral membrane protein
MNVVSEPAAEVKSSPRSGFLSDLAWFFSGAILPVGSLWFYRKASQRSVGLAILFFFAFTVIITILSTISIGVAMAGAVRTIRDAYQQGRVPEITIAGGVAQVSGPEPAILVDEHTSKGAVFVALDTTGRITSIDQSRYSQGFLLTRTELHVLNTGQRYQRVPLSELNKLFSRDPLVIDEQSVSSAWVAFSAILTVLIFIALVLWNSVVRLMIIAMLALIFWGVATLFRPTIGFGPFIITGLYAVVPAVYLSHLFTRSQVSFPGLQTIMLILFWAVGLLPALSQDKFFTVEKSPRLWTALIGLPMLTWFVVDEFANLSSPGAQIALWAVALLTGLGLAGLRLYFHLQDLQKSTQVNASQPA